MALAPDNTPALFVNARDWFADCTWQNLEPEDVAELSDAEVKSAVERYYAGGWAQLVRDCGGGEEWVEPEPRLDTHPRGRVSSLA